MSKYWDDFDRRIKETTLCLQNNKPIPVRRVAVFITNKCNFKCAYCNFSANEKELSKDNFVKLVEKYGKSAIIHITGGEPSVVEWLYKYINSTYQVRFHLNSNCFLKPPIRIRRLKASLDSNDESYFNSLVGLNAFKEVVKNIKYGCNYTITSITCVLTRENYKNTPEFMRWCRKTFKGLYAVFFSVYKGDQEQFLLTNDDVELFFTQVKPKLEKEMDEESLGLFKETIDEKFRLIRGVRFPENNLKIPCYLSMSERVVDWDNNEYTCSHLFRDGIFYNRPNKHLKCQFGCNRRLVKFNEEVENNLVTGKTI